MSKLAMHLHILTETFLPQTRQQPNISLIALTLDRALFFQKPKMIKDNTVSQA